MLEVIDGSLSGKLTGAFFDGAAKVTALNEITASLRVGASQVIAVGDGANDLGMLKLAGTSVALHAKPNVAAQCDIRVNHGDLTALLYIQGYRKEEFAS